MTQSHVPLGNDAHYLQSTARLFGWEVEWESDGSARMSRGDQTIRACFTNDGAFWFARATSPGARVRGLALAETVDALGRHGNPPALPTA